MDPIVAEIIKSSLTYASEEMGIALRNSAYSPNIKDRMDHSCAILDSQGRLIAQAEHIPVHLGSLPWGLKKTLEYIEKENIPINKGDMFIVNNPYIAGTHLNDITIIRPIFFKEKIVAYAANKAHHSDIGGKVPGSISSDATDLYQEGLIIDPVKIMERNEIKNDIVSIVSSNSRNPYQRKGDLRAQIAANLLGENRILNLIKKYGIENFVDGVNEAIDYSERVIRSHVKNFPDSVVEAEDFLELPDGNLAKLKVKIIKENDSIKIDYTGTSEQVKFPLNAVYGVTLSGVYFVIKAVTDPDIMMNHGCFNVIDVNVPEGTILNPIYPYPVSGGNVETSQRNADVLLKAFSKIVPDKIPAACGGSMNNVMIGGIHENRPWSFYETVGVGLGAFNGKNGVSGIHCNMTNTMNTPVELVELYYPLAIEKYEFRENSGGNGKYKGGMGIERWYRIKTDNTTFTILADREKIAPWGLNGGGEGAKTEVYIEKNGKRIKVPAKGSYNLSKNDLVILMTAGGGGYGQSF